jgi:ABC-type transport system involved in multi-copper enzyme maturation permease subunit
MSGAVHDLGYRRYHGTRRSPSTRWRVIMRHQIATAWSTWWRYKAWLVLAAITTVALGAIAFVWETSAAPQLAKGGMKLPASELIMASVPGYFRQIGVLLTLTIGAGVIAADAGSGAFTFYFSRPVRPIDYLAGKLAGMIVLLATLMAAPLVLLAIFRAGLATGGDDVGRYLGLVPRALGLGVLASVVYAAVPFGFSALVSRRRNAIIAWAAWYFLVGQLFAGIGIATGTAFNAIDLALSFEAIAHAVLDVQMPSFGGPRIFPPVGWALISVTVQTAIAIGVAYWKIREARRTGVVGGGG